MSSTILSLHYTQQIFHYITQVTKKKVYHEYLIMLLVTAGADNVVVNTLKLFGHYYAATELPQVTNHSALSGHVSPVLPLIGGAGDRVRPGDARHARQGGRHGPHPRRQADDAAPPVRR